MLFPFENSGRERSHCRDDAVRMCADGLQLLTPSDVFNTDCLRQRGIGESIFAIAHEHLSTEIITEVHDYLATLHDRRMCIDSDIFFPLLRDHCLPEDNIEDLIGRLENAGDSSAFSAISTAEILEGTLQAHRIAAEDARLLTVFAQSILKRAAIMKAALFPIACVRFDDAALTTLSDALLALDVSTEKTTNNHRGTQ